VAKTNFGQDNAGSTVKPAAPPASGPVMVLVDAGPTLSLAWGYSGSVNGTTTFYIVDNGFTLGRERSAS